MKRRNPHIDPWLAAERAGDEARAESAFAAVMARLPRLAPPAGFADRVLAAVPFVARSAAPAAWGWRWAVAAALALTGVAAWLLPALRWLPFEMPRFTDVVKAWAVATGSVMAWVEVGLALWASLLQFGGWVAVAIETPEIAAALAGSAAVGAVALYTLNHLLSLERSSWR